MQDKLRQFFQQRIISPQGQAFPMMPQPFLNQSEALQSVAGLTTQATPRGDIAFARKLAAQQNALKEISLEDFNNLLKIARQNLDIPQGIFRKMKLEQILSELLGLAEKPR